jgi:phosphate acetyltransferase
MGAPLDEGLEYIENKTYDEIRVGDGASLQRTLSERDIQLFAVMSGDVNPAHVDPDYAKNSMFHEVIAHGLWGGALISTVLGTLYPGPGTVYIDQSLHFSRPVTLGDTITVSVKVKEKFDRTKHVVLDCQCVNQDGRTVIRGVAEVLAPSEKIRRHRAQLPEVRLHDTAQRYRHLIERSKGIPAIDMAVVYPCHVESLGGALSAAEAGLRAVELARAGKVRALMKGSLHTDALMGPVVAADSGLRTDRRVSHVFFMDVPAYSKPLLITDAAINIEPDLQAKRDIVQNAIELAHALGIATPRVALLAAVETVDGKMRATIDAASLCKMAERGQITGGLLDGPLALDNAVSLAAAKTKGIVSSVAGQADILVVPDLEAGNILAKQLEYLADAAGAGIVLGARVPIVLTSRADPAPVRVASCALALLLAAKAKAAAA